MAATRSIIQGWIDDRPEECTHMIVVCDTYDWEDYPVYYPNPRHKKHVGWGQTRPQTLHEVVDDHRGNMQKVMEVYSFTGKYTIEEQMKEHRAHHYD